MAEGAPASEANSVAAISTQLSTMVLSDENTDVVVIESLDSVDSSHVLAAGQKESPSSTPPRQPLFGSVREALKSEGQLTEDASGYIIKRRSGRQQNLRRDRSKQRRSITASTEDSASAPTGQATADAAGYTVIRRRSSCDEGVLPSQTPRRNPRSKKQKPRRGSVSAPPQQSSLLASLSSSAPTRSAPPGLGPPTTSTLKLRPPPGLTPAASCWVAKAAEPAESAATLAEPPVAALWGPTASTEDGWGATAAASSEVQPWPPAEQEEKNDGVDGEDLLARIGL